MPAVSVIIPAYRAERSLFTVLAALAPQVAQAGDVEVIVVESSGGTTAAELRAAHAWLSVLAPERRTLPGRARNLAVDQARSATLVFLDADAVPAPDWLARLRATARAEAHKQAHAVAGAVTNGTPASPTGTVSYLLEFAEFLPTRRARPRHGATCNLLVSRDALAAAGGFCEELWPGEDTVLTLPWAAAGRLGFAPDAVVSHLNRTGVVEMLRHQLRLGRAFAGQCDRVRHPQGRFSRWPLLLVAPLLRWVAVLRVAARDGADAIPPRRLLALAPLLLLGLIAWGIGIAAERQRPQISPPARPDPAPAGPGSPPAAPASPAAGPQRPASGP